MAEEREKTVSGPEGPEMARRRTQLFASLPGVDRTVWRQRVDGELGDVSFERALVTTSDEGLRIEPLYTATTGAGADPQERPGQASLRRGSRRGPVATAAEYRGSDLQAGTLARDVERGITCAWIQADVEDRPLVAVLETWLDGVDLTAVQIFLDAGAHPVPWALAMEGLLERRGVDPSAWFGGVVGDPSAELAQRGTGPSIASSFEQTADWMARCQSRGVPRRTAWVSTTAYHRAGATAVDELALAMSGVAEWLRGLRASGLDLSSFGRYLGFSLSAGRDLFTEIAKFRAARVLWAKVAKASGVADAEAVHWHARGEGLNRTLSEPHGNLLRGTSEAFSALAGGVDSLAILPFDTEVGPDHDKSRRLAINTLHVLRLEGHLDRVDDPAGGSWYLEALTDQLARAAWTTFQSFEARGGLVAILEDGTLVEHLARSASASREAIAKRREVIVGVSDFVFLGEPVPVPKVAPQPSAEREPASDAVNPTLEGLASAASEDRLDALAHAISAGARLADLKPSLDRDPRTIEPLPTLRLAAPFEALRQASDARLEACGKRPSAFLVQLGTGREYRARADFARRFVAAAGIEATDAGGFADHTAAVEAFANAETPLAIVCSTDERYAADLEPLASALAERGARVVVAGRPGAHEEAWRTAGVEAFIYLGSDALSALRQMAEWLDLKPVGGGA